MTNNNERIRILSLEDEPVIADRIERFCREILGERISSYTVCGAVDDALCEAASGGYDLFLLDLNLHGDDGFEILRNYASYAAQTIIISAYKDKAVDAFDFGVVDFVAKPFDKGRLQLALDRFSGAATQAHYPRFLSFRSAGKAFVASLDQVIYIAGADKYSEVRLSDGSDKLHDKSLNMFEQILPDTFERIHKSYIVRLDQIEQFETQEGSRYFVVLKTGDRLPVGRTRYKSLKERYV
ncbi:MAG: LytTR family DNA-binding domain-containing protein [Pseudomonadota bacterium]